MLVHAGDLEIFDGDSCVLGEAPVWDSRVNGLYWLDIDSRQLHFKCWPDGLKKTWEIPHTASAIFLVASHVDLLLLASEVGLGVFDLRDKSWLTIAAMGAERLGWRTNDGGIDTSGRVWFGTMNSTDQLNEPGSVYSWSSDEGLRKKIDFVCIPNTFIWNSSGDVMVTADSKKNSIRRYYYSTDDGSISLDREIVNTALEEVEPDGSAMDVDDNFWNAQWGGARVIKYDLEGTPLEVISIPCAHPTSCCFGGEDMRTLFITSAVLEEKSGDGQPGGFTYFIRTKTPGVKIPKVKFDGA